MWCSVEALAGALGRLQARCHWASRLANIVSCGAMLGSAMFDPISADEDHRYCEIILPLFAVAAVVWHLLNLDILLVAGRFTIPLGLAILLLFAVLAGPSRMDLAAWLPLYVTTTSLLTVSLAPILGRFAGGGSTISSATNNLISSAIMDVDDDPDDDNDDDDEAPSQHDRPDSAAMTRWEQEPPARYHLLSHHHHARWAPLSARTPTTLSLSSTPGPPRSSWGSRVLSFWPDRDRPSLDGLLDPDGRRHDSGQADAMD